MSWSPNEIEAPQKIFYDHAPSIFDGALANVSSL
jgi:hypothetical protein